ncbi:MAG: helix-turn-helix transcriptional regulator [Clostridia bacterium]|nr:helix-turn-helix transcriptional regulator [Clostridia bacterium]MCI8979390.1 helix-turn-helix transcriptional regulator [Clostridia bacterium]MCI9086600.1 helix-turn-helix transcriptional regulator [Clostridia bacterium]
MNRTYICPVEATLEIVGGKYKPLILWHLADKILRFNQLQKLIPSATPRMLTKQLRELEENGIIYREVYPVVPPKVEYSLTDLGKSFIPILSDMCDWGNAYLKANNICPNCSMIKGQV